MALLVATNSAFRSVAVAYNELDAKLWDGTRLTSRPELLVIRLSQRTNDIEIITECLKDLYDKGWSAISSEDKLSMTCWFMIDDFMHAFDSSSGTWKKNDGKNYKNPFNCIDIAGYIND